ncbi:MAG: NifB/NifX family molybdenum-iron cluster-binding protein [Spirochaetota bacterium]|nr:NifB/NifX family molybdenum-iron cluster-binding protein [Spirochaetota bacterium]
MTICITSQGKEKSSRVDPRFGRCAYFCFYNSDTDEYSFEKNTFAGGVGGVGVQTGEMMAQKDVKVVLTGQVGPNAYRTLEAGGMEVYPNAEGTIEEAVGAFLSGQYSKTSGPTGPSHHA